MKRIRYILFGLLAAATLAACGQGPVAVSNQEETHQPEPEQTYIPEEPTEEATYLPTVTATLEATVEPTATLEPTATYSLEPTATPIPLITKIDNVVYTHFDTPLSATWALLVGISHNSYSSVSDISLFEIQINGNSYNLDGRKALEDISKYGGILVDYEDNYFTSENLDVKINLISGGVLEQSYQTNLTNWSYIGSVPLPVDLENSQFVVYHLDDIDPSNELQTSFIENFKATSSQTNGAWVCGIEPNHGNAIDIGYPLVMDNTKTLFSLSRDMFVSWTHYDTSDMGSKIVFLLPIKAIVEMPSGEVRSTKLEYGIHHFVVSPELPLYKNFGSIRNQELVADTIIGIMEMRGNNNAELHVGVYSPLCFGDNNCDPYHASNDQYALILPFSLFLSQSDKESVIDSVMNCRK